MSSLRLICITAVAFGSIGVAAADEDGVHPLLTRGVSIDVGIFLPVRELDLSVDGTIGQNERIDFDKSFNLRNTDAVFSGEMAWRFRSN